MLARLELLRHGSPADVLLQAFQTTGAAVAREMITRARLPEEQGRSALQELLQSGQLLALEPGADAPSLDFLACTQAYWSAISGRASHELENYHRQYPLRRGMPREELKSRLKMAQPRLFNAAVHRWEADGVLVEEGSLVWQPGHVIRFSPRQQGIVDKILAQFAQSPYAPPTVKDIQSEVGEDGYQALIEMGVLVPVSAEVAFRKEDYDQMVEMVRAHFAQEVTLSAAQFRDKLNTSRRYVLAFLEHLDSIGVTIRDGDVRKLRKMSNNR